MPPPPTPQPLGWRSPIPTEPARRLDDATALRSVAPLWDVRGELFGATTAAADPLGRLVTSASQEDGGNGILWRPTGRWLGRSSPRICVSLDELAGWFPSPWLRMPDLAQDSTAGAHVLALGRTLAGRPCGLVVESSQGRHVLLLGETGMGKSSLLVRLMVRAATLGAVVFFDPIGDTSRRLLDRLPDSDLSRVVWISPACSPVGINALAPAAAASTAGDRALGDLVEALRRVRVGRYADSPFWGPRVEEMVTLALRAAARYPEGTLVDAGTLLGSVGRTPRGVPPEAEDAVQDLVERVRDRPDEVDGARRVLGEVVRTPILARMLATRTPRFSLEEAIRTRRIVLVSGDAPEIGESAARTLLSVHFALLWLELVARPTAAKTFVIADELPWYANDAAVEMFRLGRRFNVHLWGATQSLAALPESVREAALTNAADLLVFRGSPDDAREIARWAPDLASESIMGLRRGEVAVLLGKGAEVAWVRLPFDPDRPRPDRWAEVWGQCRPFWSPNLDPEGPVDAAAPDESSPASGGDTVREILLLLWAGLLANPEARSLTVSLDALRDVADPSGAGVRTVGQRLSNSGALEVGHSGESRHWTVEREGVAALLGGGVSPAELADADRRWARLLAASDRSGSQKGL
jgi:hypothetical protein